MALEKNIQPETTFGISQIEKDTKLVQQAAVDNEIPSSSMLTGTGHSEAAECSTKPKAAEKEMPFISSGKELHNINKDAMVSRTENNKSQVNAKGVNDNSEKANEKMDGGTKKNKTKKRAKKSAGRSDDVAVVVNEENLLPQTEGNENAEMTTVDALHNDHVRNDNIVMNNDVELSRTERNMTQVNDRGINDELHKQNEKMA